MLLGRVLPCYVHCIFHIFGKKMVGLITLNADILSFLQCFLRMTSSFFSVTLSMNLSVPMFLASWLCLGYYLLHLGPITWISLWMWKDFLVVIYSLINISLCCLLMVFSSCWWRYFEECQHPNERQRLQLGRELGLTPTQIKFWFQNKRTLVKVLYEILISVCGGFNFFVLWFHYCPWL